MISSPSRTLPQSSTKIARSASPSNATPNSAFSFRTIFASRSGCSAPASSLILRPFGLSLMTRTFAPGRAQLILDLLLDRIRELHPVVTEDLHAVVVERIVRRGDRDPGGGVGGAAEVRDRGRRHDADELRLAAALGDSRGERVGDLRPRFARVHAEEDRRMRAQPVRERLAEREDRRRIERVAMRFPADAVSAEQGSHSWFRSWSFPWPAVSGRSPPSPAPSPAR